MKTKRIQGNTLWVNPEPSLEIGRCNDYPVMGVGNSVPEALGVRKDHDIV
jgi:hypothetical protein